MSINITDFDKIWASTSPLTPYAFTESNYKQGWNFVGSTPPSRQMWDAFMQSADEKSQWLYNETVRINQVIIQDIPVGIVQAFAGATTPDGWLLCDGSAVSRTDYAELFSVIGTTYGDGDGSTTFNLPNLTDRFIQGNATAGTVKSAGLPDIKGDFSLRSWGTGAGDAVSDTHEAFQYSSVTSSAGAFATSSAGNHLQKISFDASRSSSVYGNSTTVQPPALTMRYVIKY